MEAEDPRPRLLDAFCCAGGATKGYQCAGFHVTGIDSSPQPNYCGDELIVGNALTYLSDRDFLSQFAAIHASPPCQMFTAYRRAMPERGDDQYVNLIPATRLLLERSNLPYVIENVPNAPLRDPIMICGSHFDPLLDVQRHRLFEANWGLEALGECRHGLWEPRFKPAANRKNLRKTVEIGAWRQPVEVQQAAIGIDWMTVAEMSQAIPPRYTEEIGRQLMKELGLAQVIEAFGGGEVLMDESSPESPGTAEWVAAFKQRGNVKVQVSTCASCELSATTSPVPYSGPAKPLFAIVGEAPGRREAALGEPFVGPAGRLMRSMLEEAGLEGDRALWMNTVSCYPKGTPSDHHIRACRNNLVDQLALSPNPWVLLVGQTALSSFRECLSITKAKGAAYYRDGRVWFPVWHPAYILRDRSKRAETVEDLARFATLVDGELPPKFTLSEQCQRVGCGEVVDIYDDEAVSWCSGCWETREWREWTEEERAAETRRVEAVRVAKAHIAHQKGRKGKSQARRRKRAGD